MKTNKIMRVASVLLVAVLLTTCAISGTFAKYVTTATSGDSARVAKWGITMTNLGDNTFIDHYDTGLVDGVIVAPGTTYGTTYEVDGTPETAYQLTFVGTLTEEVFLADAAYDYLAHYNGMDIAEGGLTETYYPIKYTVTVTTTRGEVENNAADTYNTLQAALAAISAMTVTYAPGTECDFVLGLSWAWAIADQNDVADTILGDLATAADDGSVDLDTDELVDGTDYNLDISYTLKMIATQLDTYTAG